jgi:transposase
MKTPPLRQMDLRRDELEALLQRAQAALSEADYQLVQALVESYAYVTDLLEDKRTTIDRLRKLLFGAGSEKTHDVLPPVTQTPAAAEASVGSPEPPNPVAAGPAKPESPPPRPGHGRNGADDYAGAERIRVPHGSLRPSDPCPACREGTVYEFSPPGVLVRIVGQAPVQARVYELQKLRCNACGKVFTAASPEGVGEEKYDASAAAMIALLKYGSGMPFHRLDGLQESLGLPLPASTQWSIVRDAAAVMAPAHEELIRQAAQGQVVHNDDTGVKILEFMGKRARATAPAQDATGPPAPSGTQRRGMFTSGIVSTNQDRRIALFFSGRRHAGENLAQVLQRRAEELGPPIQMCDALARNLPAGFKTLLANCLAHGRRQFVEVAERFPQACRHVLEELAEVYKHDDLARQQKLSPEDRLAYHQAHSGPIMERLQEWLAGQFEERLVEPNSSLGEAISYLLNHWEPLTLFLRQAGAPLDNNIAERALKQAIRNRKNALFYKTLNGAHVGDVFMSLIHTCQLNEANPFDYLTELQRHSGELALHPEQWMPWNYRQTLGGVGTPSDSAC